MFFSTFFLPDSFLYFFHTLIGTVLFIPLYAIWVTFLLPGVWASMLAGALYGTWLGSLLVFFGAVLGAECVFFLSRTIFRDWASTQLLKYPKLLKIGKTVTNEGLKFVFLTRLSPAFPFSLLNLAYGLSEISFRDYSIGLIGILPGTILFCELGSIAGDLTRFQDVLSNRSDIASYSISLIGGISTILVVFIIGRAIKLALETDNK